MTIFSVHTDTDDVELVLEAVAQAVQQWDGGDQMALDLSLLQGREQRLVLKARQLRFQSNLDGQAIIHSTRPRLGPWVIRFQHMIRRITWWFTDPILNQIRTFQMSAARVVEGLAENQESILIEIQQRDLPSEDSNLTRLDVLEKQITALQAQLDQMRRDLDAS